jgi:hypothetical protein
VDAVVLLQPHVDYDLDPSSIGEPISLRHERRHSQGRIRREALSHVAYRSEVA